MTDIEIARSVTPEKIQAIANKIGVKAEDLELYGHHKAKLPLNLIDDKKAKNSALILVTAITPTPAGEGKTTTTIGLHDALSKVGKKSIAVIREPSLGPVFGIKGGAAGGGYSQVIPMEDINLHFTGDFSAIEKANNLLSAMIDNNIQSKSRSIGIDHRSVLWKRVMDMNDRALRNIISSLGGKGGGFPTESGFNITAASEVMAILCMSKDLNDLQRRLGNIYIGDDREGEPVFAQQLNAQGAMTILMKDAIKPNLVQTLEGNPTIIHGGPFANIAQGTNSILATKMGMSLGDYVITEAGFGADLGAEKFLNIKCREAGVSPKTVVIVATIRALKYHGGQDLKELSNPNVEALEKGLPNLERHIESMQSFGLPVVISLNRFSQDSQEEIDFLMNYCKSKGVRIALSEGWAKGGEGCVDLAEQVIEAVAECKNDFIPTYQLNDSIEEKIQKVVSKIYGGEKVEFAGKAKIQLKKFEKLGFDKMPICMAKTQKSLSDNERLIGRPSGFNITVREFEVAAGAGFIIPICGNMMRMPGLPATPAAENMSIDENGEIFGLS